MSRYTITREYVGAAEPHFVARFCGDWIGSSASKWDAIDHMKRHADEYRPQITAHRPPTKAEIKFGYGATHYADFNYSDFMRDDGTMKTRIKSHRDGLWYSRA